MDELLPLAMVLALSTKPTAVALERPASCLPDRPAAIARAVKPVYPAIAKFANLTGTASIRVDLSETGALLGSYVAVSSGSSILDQAALRTVKSMVYEPATRSCSPVAGSYAVDVEFAE